MAYVYGKSLAEYMDTRKKKSGRACYVCSLPNDIRCQVERGFFDKGWPMTAIHEWLRDVMGEKEATRTKLQGHLGRHERLKVEG